MSVSRGYPRGAGAVLKSTGALSTTGGGDAAAASIDLSLITDGMNNIVNALTTTADVSRDILKALILETGQALVVLAGDYKAYFDLTAMSNSFLKVINDATASLYIYGDLSVDNDTECYFANDGIIVVRGD